MFAGVEDLSAGVLLSPTTLRQLSYLDRLYKHGPAGTRMPVQPLLAGGSNVSAASGEEELRADLRELAAGGWISLAETNEIDTTDCALTPTGSQRLENIRTRRQDPMRRRRAARAALLRWLYDRKVAGVHRPVISDFFTSPHGLYYGHPFPERDVDDASMFLRSVGLLTGTGSNGGGIARPSITAAGEAHVESGRALDEVNPGTASPEHDSVGTRIMITGDNNFIQAHSPGAHASVTTTITVDDRLQVLQLADVLDDALPILPEEAAALPAALRAAVAEGQDDPGVVRSVLESAKSTLTSGVGAVVGNALLAGVKSLLTHYGIPLG